MFGFDDCGGSKNSPLGAESCWIVCCSIGKEENKKKGENKGYTDELGSEIKGQHSLATAPEMLVVIS